MKNVYFVLAALIIGATAVAQGTPQERTTLRNDLARERNKRHDVARDIVRGEPERARADHRAAVTYHEKAHADVNQIQRHGVQEPRRHPRVVVRHHYSHRRHYVHHRHYTHHRRPHHTVVVIRH